MSNSKFYAFYTWVYGMEYRREEFDDEKDVLAFVKRANDPTDGVRGLTVIYGQKLEFEPCKVVESYRIKE